MSPVDDDIVSLRCSVQRALLGAIVPSIRAVMAEITPETRIVWVFFDTPAAPEELELLSVAETELLADYPDDKVLVRALTLPSPTRLPKDRGIWVYARYEPD